MRKALRQLGKTKYAFRTTVAGKTQYVFPVICNARDIHCPENAKLYKKEIK
jgi:hypothetical protein